MYSAMMPVSAAAVSLFFRNQTILKREKSSTHIITYLLPPTLVVGMLSPWSTKKRPALRVKRVFVDFCTTYDALLPWSRRHTASRNQTVLRRVAFLYLE